MISVQLHPASCPPHFANCIDLWIGNELRAVGIPVVEAALNEGVKRGALYRTDLPNGVIDFTWIPPDSAASLQ